MLSTRSIGGKLACGLVSLLALLVLFGVTTALSLRAHSKMVRNLAASIKDSKNRKELIATFGTLIDPLVIPTPSEADQTKLATWAELQRQDFQGRLEGAEAKFHELRRKIETSSLGPNGLSALNRELTALFDGHQKDLRDLRDAMPLLGDPEKRAAQIQWMLPICAGLIERAIMMPDPAEEDHLIQLLRDAQADQKQYTLLALGFGATAIVCVIVIALGGYRWILQPLRALHADFDRVAKGDYAHRANVTTQDEIQSLADAFNVMTDRFQDVVHDQNDQIQMQAQKLLQSERVAGIGFLATGVAHEINNPLGVISMCGDAIARQLITPVDQWKPSDISEVKEYSQMICNETMRCQNITHRMLDFAHGSTGEKNCYDLTAIVREVVGLVGHLGKYNDRKIVFDNSMPCEAWVSGEEIRQVVLNLVANALQAMKPGGVLKITLNETADQIDLAFQDDGCGMAPETLQKLFEPFFTTKDAGQGTGLGLSLTRKIIESHGGTIAASSSGVGHGSTFRVRLPRSASSSRAA
ncbi:MAG: sensor histidine kinase [Planctomycetota bacterium]|nr:MAG: sensor histidine kinase [Planctomycetota bacterium]